MYTKLNTIYNIPYQYNMDKILISTGIIVSGIIVTAIYIYYNPPNTCENDCRCDDEKKED